MFRVTAGSAVLAAVPLCLVAGSAHFILMCTDNKVLFFPTTFEKGAGNNFFLLADMRQN